MDIVLQAFDFRKKRILSESQDTAPTAGGENVLLTNDANDEIVTIEKYRK